MSAPVLRAACPVCAAPTPVRGGRYVPHERPSRSGEPYRTAWCEGRDRQASREALLAGLDAIVREAADGLRAACDRASEAAADLRAAHSRFVHRRAWARRLGAAIAEGAP